MNVVLFVLYIATFIFGIGVFIEILRDKSPYASRRMKLGALFPLSIILACMIAVGTVVKWW